MILITSNFRKLKTIVAEGWSVVSRGWGWKRILIAKGYEGTHGWKKCSYRISANICKGPNSKQFRLCRPYSLRCNYSMNSHRQYSMEGYGCVKMNLYFQSRQQVRFDPCPIIMRTGVKTIFIHHIFQIVALKPGEFSCKFYLNKADFFKI